MLKVVVIDDDILITNMLQDILPADTFEVFVANSGREGIELVQQISPDVIMLDLMMPGIGGWDVCRTIRTFSQTPILVVSAVVDSQGVMQALDAGADDYLLKPLPQGTLISRLKKLAQRARPA